MAVELDMSQLAVFEKKLRGMTQRKIQEGFSGTHHSGLTNASLAYMLEEGRRGDINEPPIPARPAFKDSLFKLKVEGIFQRRAQELYTEYLQGTITQEAFFQSLGSIMVSGHKKTMRNWYLVGSEAKHNAPITIKNKGFDQPFVEDGELVSSVHYEVV